MAATKTSKKGNEPPAVVIKRVKKGGHAAHHGGSWKVAYADFVTAMMAFFLLLWLLNVTTDEQKRGIADYFAPSIASESQSGSGGVLGGQTLSADGALMSVRNSPSVTVLLEKPSDVSQETDSPPTQEQSVAAAAEDPTKETLSGAASEDPFESPDIPSVEDAKKMLAEEEEKHFRQAEHDLRQAIQDVPELASLVENLIIDRTQEGLRIQIVDQDKTEMFDRGSAKMLPHTERLLGLIAEVVKQMPNQVAISGHTDSTPYAQGQEDYTNWELSADRANASRRALLRNGIPVKRIARVVGKAEHEPLVGDNPADPRNRRITIVLLRENEFPTSAAAVEEPSSPTSPGSPTLP